MGWGTLVVQSRPRLSKVAEHHPWVSILPGPLPCLYIWHACGSLADMLAHSPPLPLVIDYEGTDITAEDEDSIILALEQRDRVRRIRFDIPDLEVRKLIMAIDGKYPILEYLILWDPPEDKSTVLIFPETLETPHLRHLAIDCSISIRSPLLTTAVGLVTLNLGFHHPSTYFQPTVLLQSLSLMPQLEMFLIYFNFAVPTRDVERRTPIMTHLRSFSLRAVSAYSEAVLSRITAPRLEDIQICYHKQLAFSVPQLLQLVGRTQNLRFGRATFEFLSERVYVGVNPPETNMPDYAFSIVVACLHLDWQVSSVTQIFNALGQIFSTVEHLTFVPQVHSRSSEEHNEVDRTEWRKLLKTFSNVKTLLVEDGLVRDSLVVYDWRMERNPRSFYPNCKISHTRVATIPMMHSPHSSMLAGTQAAP
jgi:hypothetical protein